MGNANDDRRVAEIVDIIAFKTLQMLFGEDNDTTGGSDNETDGVAYGIDSVCRRRNRLADENPDLVQDRIHR